MLEITAKTKSVEGKGGLWKENSWIDKVDKTLSRVIFNLDLGWHFEMVATIPGYWFGTPLISLILWPLLVATIISNKVPLMITFLIISLIYLTGWIYKLNIWLNLKHPQEMDVYGIDTVIMPSHGTAYEGNRIVEAFFFLVPPHLGLMVIYLVSE
jgi:hypothetical protein